MKYFKNTELAKLYNVSEKSVRNWVQAAQEGKLELQLYTSNGKTYIANTPLNAMAIEGVVAKGRKYKNTRAFKVVTPTEKFYELCTPKQIYDLIANIDIHREIPHQYSYLDGGAVHWDQYAHKLLNEKTPNSVTNTIELLDVSEPYIDSILAGNERVNIIDIGPGNCLPIKDMLASLHKNGKLNRYIGLDVSPEMLEIARQNIEAWYNHEIDYEDSIRDINYDRFEDLVISSSFRKDNTVIPNLILFFGGTISNLRDPDQALRIINNSMGKNDIFMLSRKLDTAATRRFFDFSAGPKEAITLDMKEKNMLDLMGIDDSLYEVEQFFDEQKMARIMQIRFKVDLTINFQLEGNKRNIDILKGETLLLWRSDHKSLLETVGQLNQNGFDVIQATKSRDQQYALFIAKLKTVS